MKFRESVFPVPRHAWNLGPIEAGSTDCIAGIGAFDFDGMFLSICVAAIRGPLVLAGFVIIGDVFLQGVYTIFDFDHPPRVHFAELV